MPPPSDTQAKTEENEWSSLFQGIKGKEIESSSIPNQPWNPTEAKLECYTFEKFDRVALANALIHLTATNLENNLKVIMGQLTARDSGVATIIDEAFQDSPLKLEYKIANPVKPDMSGTNADLAKQATDWSLDQMINRAIFVLGTYALTQKMDEETFIGYVETKLPRIATSAGVDALEKIPHDHSSYLVAKALFAVGGIGSKSLMTLFIGLGTSSQYKETIRAAAVLRLAGAGATTAHLLLQVAAKLGITPHELILEIRTKLLKSSVVRVYSYLMELDACNTPSDRLGFLLCRMLSTSYHNTLGVKHNANLVGLMAKVLVIMGDEDADAITGAQLSEANNTILSHAATGLVEKYGVFKQEGSGSIFATAIQDAKATQGVSSIFRSARRSGLTAAQPEQSTQSQSYTFEDTD